MCEKTTTAKQGVIRCNFKKLTHSLLLAAICTIFSAGCGSCCCATTTASLVVRHLNYSEVIETRASEADNPLSRFAPHDVFVSYFDMRVVRNHH